jgi:hypothetical protein
MAGNLTKLNLDQIPSQKQEQEIVKEEIELDETTLEEVTGGAAVDYFHKGEVKLLSAVQSAFTGGVSRGAGGGGGAG